MTRAKDMMKTTLFIVSYHFMTQIQEHPKSTMPQKIYASHVNITKRLQEYIMNPKDSPKDIHKKHILH